MRVMTMRRRMVLSVVSLVLVLVVGSSACGDGDDGDGTSAPSSPTSTSTSTTTNAGGPSTTGSSTTDDGHGGGSSVDGEFPPPVTAPLPSRGQPMADGVHAVFLEGVDVDAGEITVDVVQFLTGEEANRAYREETGEDEDAPNDFYVRNASQDQRTVAVAADARVTVAWRGEEVRENDVSFDELPAYLESRDAEGNDRIIFWVAVDDDTVTRLFEQYVP